MTPASPPTRAKESSHQQFIVEGHTDSRGSTAFNEDLSRRRADSVRDYLVKRGVDANTIRAVGRGESEPIAANTSAEGRANNRRVEIIVTDPPDKSAQR